MSEMIIGTETPDTLEKRTQVFMATHDGEGNRLPLMNRSFISFTYGGRAIEDFGLISVTDGDSIKRDLYGKVNNNVTSYKSIDGQFFWDSHLENNSLTLRLATDGITEHQLNDFKNYFTPGPAKELILAENGNRGIQARIDSAPQYDMQVFEQKVTRKIRGIAYTTSTTLYKGFITLNFIMDDPYWYSVKNLITQPITPTNPEQDLLKVIFEDNIPHQEMMTVDAFLGGTEGYYNKDEQTYSGATTLTAGLDDKRYLYYAGTAPGKPILSFKLKPIVDTDEAYIIDTSYDDTMSLIYDESTNQGARIKEGTNYGAYIYVARVPDSGQTGTSNTFYISSPHNSFIDTGSEYNTITLKAADDTINNVFKFTLPSIYKGYNQAIKIFDSYEAGQSLIELRTKIKENVKEAYSRAWATAVINFIMTTTGEDTAETVSNVNIVTALKKMMWYFLIDGEGKLPDAKFSFNSQTGEAIGEFQVRQYDTSIVIDDTQIDDNTNLIEYFADMTKDKLSTISENVGDMVYDKYLTIDRRNYPNDLGIISENECQKMTTDYQNGLSELNIVYKNLYL